MDGDLILSVIANVVLAVLTIVSFAIKLVSGKSAKTALSEITKEFGLLEQLKAKVSQYMGEAEGHINFSGVDKKAYVIAKTVLWANSCGYNTNTVDIEAIIEENIKLSKEVNNKNDTKRAGEISSDTRGAQDSENYGGRNAETSGSPQNRSGYIA